MTSYPAGWYPDEARPGWQRYWDGTEWTQYVHQPGHPPGVGRRRAKTPAFRPAAQLVSATYRMLFADKAMIALLLVGAVVAAAVSSAILFPATYWGDVSPTWDQGGVAGVLVAGAALGSASFVFQLVTGAVVAAAMLRADGHPASARAALVIAWSRRRQLLAWAALSTVVGGIIRMLERVGIGGLVAGVTLDIGWSFATVFATPVIMVEGTMPLDTVRRSARVLRRHFSVTLVSSVALALPWILLGCGAVVVAITGGFVLALGSGVVAMVSGALLISCGAVGICYSAAVSSALSAYLEAILYRYAVGLPIPGVDRAWLPPLLPE